VLAGWKSAKPFMSIVFGCLLVASACATPEQRHRLATTFFDGVPPLQREEEPAPGALGSQRDARALPAKVSSGEPASNVSIHGPYGQKKCGQCHASQFSNRLKATGAELCFACHELDSFPGTIRHGPFQAGKCMACHDPHRAPNRYLLLAKGIGHLPWLPRRHYLRGHR